MSCKIVRMRYSNGCGLFNRPALDGRQTTIGLASNSPPVRPNNVGRDGGCRHARAFGGADGARR
jgi:hypothetical protein